MAGMGSWSGYSIWVLFLKTQIYKLVKWITEREYSAQWYDKKKNQNYSDPLQNFKSLSQILLAADSISLETPKSTRTNFSLG